MLTLKSPTLNIGVTTALGSAMLLVMTTAMTADAQSGRVKARSDRGVVSAVSGPEGRRGARARGCNQVEGGQNCGSTAMITGLNGNMAGRGSVSEIGEDGSFNRDAGAYGQTQYGAAQRTLNSDFNADGSGQRVVDSNFESETGFADRNAMFAVDEQGNVSRMGEASGANEFGVFSSEGAGTYSEETGLDYERDSQAAWAGEDGALYANRGTSYDQESGFELNNSFGGSAENENGSVQTQTESSFTRDEGYVLDSEFNASNAEGGTLDASATYDAENGLERSAICTNPQGETVPCAG